MRVCLIASSRFPIREPFAGGLESMTHALAAGLAARGHEVTLFAGSGSDPDLPVRLLAPSGYAELVRHLARTAAAEFDVVHNNSLDHRPVAMAPMLGVPTLTTLHTPPLRRMEASIARHPRSSDFVAVSDFTARSWAHAVRARVIPNGVDLGRWHAGAGGGPAVWSGRLVPEKAPHEAIDAARRAEVDLVLVGPAHDEGYFRDEIEPRLGGGIRYAGHLDHAGLGRLLASASTAVVTPGWDEPYGLVAAEAMACGTPVAGYARGGLAEVVGTDGGELVTGGDVEGLAAAILRTQRMDRGRVRAHAQANCDVARTLEAYEACYRSLVTGEAA